MSAAQVIGLFTDVMGAGVNAANAGASGLSPGMVIGVGQTAQSLGSMMCDAATTAGKLVGRASLPLSALAFWDSYRNYSNSKAAGTPVKTADVIGMYGAAVGLGGGVLLLMSASGAILIPVAMVGVGLGAYQLVAQAKGWTEDGFERALTNEEQKAIDEYLKNDLPYTQSLMKDLLLPNFSASQDCDCNTPGIAPGVNDAFNNSRRSASPLVIDTDGDGFDIVQFAQSNVLFDFDADGIKTKTAWFSGDDVMLVRDINANGQIDSGRELFGNNTLLRNGSQNAADGYAALADLDSNQESALQNSKLM